MKEFEWIARYFAPLAASTSGALGLLSDGAYLDVPAGQRLVVTADALVAGVHFLGTEPPALIARKLLRVNLSDLAAMGAVPLGYLLTVALPRNSDESLIAGLAAGLKEDQEQFGLHLYGGDTVSTPGPMTLSVTMFGTVPAGEPMLTRRGARPGDVLAVTGTLGDAALGLKIVTSDEWRVASLDISSLATHHSSLIERYLLPQPRLTEGQKLRTLAHAGMDISDGLASDVARLCAASGVGARVWLERLPLSEAFRVVSDEWRVTSLVSPLATHHSSLLPATGGDDYELLLAMAPEDVASCGVTLTVIGGVTENRTVSFEDATGQKTDLSGQGYRHFS